MARAPSADPAPSQQPLTLALAAALDAPLVPHMYTADPSARVFDSRLWLYTSHDQRGARPDAARFFDMRDYHVFSVHGADDGPIEDEGVALSVDKVPWAKSDLWAPDVVRREVGGKDTYFLYFPAKDERGDFRIGVATSSRPEGPFAAQPAPIEQSLSIDPCAFVDDDGKAYLYFGGLWGGQLERWRATEPERARGPLIAQLSDDMLRFASAPHEVALRDEGGAPLREDDRRRRFFEGAWVHKRLGAYHLTYSTGDTHLLAHATAKSPLGPFTHRGTLLEPVSGWTTHPSVFEYGGRWWLAHHDSACSGGDTYRRCAKVARLFHRADGSIAPVRKGAAEENATLANASLAAEESAAVFAQERPRPARPRQSHPPIWRRRRVTWGLAAGRRGHLHVGDV